MINTPEYYIDRYSILRHNENIHDYLKLLIKEVQIDCTIAEQTNNLKHSINLAADDALKNVDWLNFPKEMFKAGANWAFAAAMPPNSEGEVATNYLIKLSNQDLVAKVRKWVRDLALSGGKAWALQVPVNFEKDPDVLIEELCRRIELLSTMNPPEIWIYDRWPEYMESVLICSIFGNVLEAQYTGEGNKFYVPDEHVLAKCWKPLPEAPTKVLQPEAGKTEKWYNLFQKIEDGLYGEVYMGAIFNTEEDARKELSCSGEGIHYIGTYSCINGILFSGNYTAE